MGALSTKRIRLNRNKINGLPNPTDKDRENYKDIDCPELTISVMRSGTKLFCVFYRVYQPDGTSKPAYYNLGNALSWSIEEAQETARDCVRKGKEGWDYKKYVATLSKATSEAVNKEQIDVHLAAVGDLPGQLARGWDDLVKRKWELGKETQQNLKGTYRKHVMSMWSEDTWIKDISEQQCIEWKARFQDKPVIWNRTRAYLIQVFENEIYERRLERNPLKRVPEYKAKKDFVVLSETGIGQFNEFFDDPMNYPPHQRNYCRNAMILLLTGQRPINLRSLKKADDGGEKTNYVDYDNQEFVYRVHKSAGSTPGIAETIPFSEEVLQLLKDAASENPDSEWAIPSCDKRERYRKLPLSEERARVFFNQFRDKLETEGLEELTIYKLRHSYATSLLKSGVSKEMVGAMLLHSPNSRATSRYARILDDSKRETAKIAAGLFKKG